jgi:hypothetical protein
MQRTYKIKIDYPIGDHNYYLPCDITHYTCKKYYTNLFPGFQDVINIIGPSDHSLFNGKGYFQDGYIQLYNETNYINLCNMSIIDSDTFEDKIKKCISSECLYTHKRNGEIIKYLKGDIINTNNIFYKPDSNNEYEEIIEKSKKLQYDFLTDKFIKISVRLESEQNKGGNFISAPDGTIFCIEGASNELLDVIKLNTTNKIIKLKCSFKSNNFRHIDELMCFMPYGLNRYKIWFYDILDESSFRKLQHDSIEKLNEERLENLNKISNALFNEPYENHIDKFVFLKFYSYKPSIFNRIWYETADNCICLFPFINDDISKQINCEMINLHSMINPTIQINYFFIKVKDANELIPEGSVHCLIKQRFVRPYTK